jgi:hypothetical protein
MTNGYVNNTGTSQTGGVNASASVSTTVPTMNDNNWHHYVATMTSTNVATGAGTINIYYDNVLKTTSNSLYYPYSNIPNNASANSYFFIGGSVNNGNIGWDTGWRGNIDNFRMYSRILTTTEIANLYNYGS